MNQYQFEQERERIFQKLENAKPPGNVSCNLSGRIVGAVGGVAGILPCALIGTLTGIITNHLFDKTNHDVAFGIAGAVFGGVFMLIQHLETHKISYAHLVGERILSMFGRAPELDAPSANEIALWAEKCPRIRDICIKWGASNKDMTLNQRDYHQLKRFKNKIEKAEHKMKVSAQKNQAVNEAMEKNGLMDAIKAHGAHRQLSSDTTGASGQAKPRRV